MIHAVNKHCPEVRMHQQPAKLCVNSGIRHIYKYMGLNHVTCSFGFINACKLMWIYELPRKLKCFINIFFSGVSLTCSFINDMHIICKRLLLNLMLTILVSSVYRQSLYKTNIFRFVLKAIYSTASRPSTISLQSKHSGFPEVQLVAHCPSNDIVIRVCGSILQ